MRGKGSKGASLKSPFPSEFTYIKMEGDDLMGWFELLYVVFACIAFKLLLENAGKGGHRRAGHRK